METIHSSVEMNIQGVNINLLFSTVDSLCKFVNDDGWHVKWFFTSP